MFVGASRHTIRRASGARMISTSPVFQRFDKSILYPTFLVVILGSQILNVMNVQKSVEDLERRYDLKMRKIDEIKGRLADGEKIDTQKELALVNKLFERTNQKDYLKSTSDKFKDNVGGFRKNHPDTKSGDNSLDGLDGDLSDESLNKFLGLDQITTEKQNVAFEEPKTLEKLSSEHVDLHVENEKKLLNYKLDPHRHVVVESPGDYVSAAKDTKVAKFL